MQQNMPNGPGICYQKKDNGTFDFDPMISKAAWSYESIHWLSYLESKPPFCTTDRQINIRHALNGGEVEVIIEGRRYKVDGFAEIDGVEYYCEFDGCNFHKHDCITSLKSGLRQRNDQQRNKDLQTKGKLIQIFECEWLKIKPTVNYKISVSRFFGRRNISEREILDSVIDGSFYGIIRVDIHSPQAVVDHFMKVRFPPIFAHVSISEEMVEEKMRAHLKERGVKYPIKNQLTLVFNRKQYVLTSDLARFYITKGMHLTNLTLAIEYTKSKPLKKFIDTVTAKRKEATLTGDSNLQNTWKLVSNSCYGRLTLNLMKRRKYKYVPTNQAPVIDDTPFITNISPVAGEFDTEFVEVTQKRQRIVDKVPGKYLPGIYSIESKFISLNQTNILLLQNI